MACDHRGGAAVVNESERYTVACCTPFCEWKQDCASDYAARQAGRQHEHEHAGHITFVFRPDSVGQRS